jgi:hypothetical protein
MQSNSSLYDLDRVLKSAELYASKANSEFFSIVTGLYGDVDDSGVDIYRDLVSFVVTRFTNNGHIVLLVFGLVYGYLYAKCLSTLLQINSLKNYQTAFVLLSFSMIFSMDQIAGIRFATASYLFFYGVINYLRTNEIKYFFILTLACLVHFSYISLILLFFIYILTKPSEKLLYIVIGLSFIAGTLFQGLMQNVFSFLGGSLEARANLYLGVEGDKGNVIWFVEYREELMNAFIVIFFIVSKLLKIKVVENSLSQSLFKFTLLILILSNFTMSIPDAGYRFNLVFIFFYMAYVYVTYNLNYRNKNINSLYTLSAVFFILQIFYATRNILFYSPLMLFYGGVPLFPFMSNEVLTWDFIMSLF